MTDPLPDGIWPPHEAFYLEALLYLTTAALHAADEVAIALEHGSQHQSDSPEWQEAAHTIIDGVQTLATHAAAISRYFWPSRSQPPHRRRGERLRTGLGVSEESPLKSRELRNHLEHFDERLDDFCRNLLAGHVLPTYVGPLGPAPEVPTILFRAYYTDCAVLEVLGLRFEMEPLLNAIQDLHQSLRDCARTGWRLPYPADRQERGRDADPDSGA